MAYGYGYAQRAARSADMRSSVIVLSIITGVWTLLWGVDLIEEITTDKHDIQPKLTTFAIVLAALYFATAGICVFGVIAAAVNRRGLAAVYAFFAVIGAIAVVGAGFVRTITHFTLKGELISECISVVTGQGLNFRFGIWGPVIHETLNQQEATQFCNNGWSTDTTSEIVNLIVEILLSIVFIAVAFSYVSQLGAARESFKYDPNRVPEFDAQAQGYPSTYNPPYLSYNAPPNDPPVGGFVPPSGPPPGFAAPYDPHGGPRSKGLDSDDGSDPFEDFEAAKREQR